MSLCDSQSHSDPERARTSIEHTLDTVSVSVTTDVCGVTETVTLSLTETVMCHMHEDEGRRRPSDNKSTTTLRAEPPVDSPMPQPLAPATTKVRLTVSEVGPYTQVTAHSLDPRPTMGMMFPPNQYTTRVYYARTDSVHGPVCGPWSRRHG